MYLQRRVHPRPRQCRWPRDQLPHRGHRRSELIGLLEEHQVEFTREPSNNWFTQLLSWVLPALIFVGIWLFIIRRMSGGGSLMSIGKSKAKVYMEKGNGHYLRRCGGH